MTSENKSLSTLEDLKQSVAGYTESTAYEVIDEEGVLGQCGDWAFIYELLEDFLREKDASIGALQEGLKEKDHEKYFKAAHAIKGAAMNLHLPALVTISKAAEAAGKLLFHYPKEELPNYATLVANLGPYIDRITAEYQRLQDYLPIAAQLRDEEAAGGGEGEYEEGEEGGEEEEYEEGEEYEEEQR